MDRFRETNSVKLPPGRFQRNSDDETSLHPAHDFHRKAQNAHALTVDFTAGGPNNLTAVSQRRPTDKTPTLLKQGI